MLSSFPRGVNYYVTNRFLSIYPEVFDLRREKTWISVSVSESMCNVALPQQLFFTASDENLHPHEQCDSCVCYFACNVNYLETTGFFLTIVLENSTMLCSAHDIYYWCVSIYLVFTRRGR